eukprot:1148297-Pelagomonas_calceolata.AAC.4
MTSDHPVTGVSSETGGQQAPRVEPDADDRQSALRAQEGQTGDSTCSLPGGKQRREVLPRVLDMELATVRHQPSRDSQVLEGGSEQKQWASCCQCMSRALQSAAGFLFGIIAPKKGFTWLCSVQGITFVHAKSRFRMKRADEEVMPGIAD